MHKTSYVLQNRRTRLMAHYNSAGQHDGLVTDDVGDAKEFATFGECAEYSQNFDDEWQPESTHSPVPYVDYGDALTRELDYQTGGR